MVCVALHTANRYHFLNSLVFQAPFYPDGGKVQREAGGRRGERERRQRGKHVKLLGNNR